MVEWWLRGQKASYVHCGIYRGLLSLSTDSQGISQSLKWCRDVNAPAVTVYYSQYKTNSCIVYEDDVITSDASLALRGRLLWVSITLVGCWGKWCPVHGSWACLHPGLVCLVVGPRVSTTWMYTHHPSYRSTVGCGTTPLALHLPSP